MIFLLKDGPIIPADVVITDMAIELGCWCEEIDDCATQLHDNPILVGPEVRREIADILNGWVVETYRVVNHE